MNIYKVDKTCLRYVVPFQYRGTFEEAFQKVEAQKGIRRSGEPFPLWERKTITSETTESDLYDYIRNEFLFDEEKGNLSDQKAGCGWLYERGHRIKKLSYYPGGIKEKPTQESEC
jgi:hypothetical protein